MKIEVCINRLEDIKPLQSLAVDRIELCIELACGGLTPSLAMVEQALAISAIPIHVLVRPRSGHFVYSEATLLEMKKTMEQLQDLG
ncbi:MAG: copper homeostasis protein CutC, partial [Flavobacteriaceae bacterium]